MSRNSYWATTFEGRLSRRRALGASGATGLGAALLAACGGGNKETTPADKSGLVYKPVETTKQAKRGGTWKWWQQADVVGLDPYFTSGASNTYCRWIYNRLWTYKIVKDEPATYETVFSHMLLPAKASIVSLCSWGGRLMSAKGAGP